MADEPVPVGASNERVRATYDRVAGVYERLLGPVEAPSQRRAVALLAAEADLGLAGARVVEVGCGPGGRLADLRRRVGQDGTVVGLDAAPAMADRAQGRGGTAVLGDARRLPLAAGSVDAVCALDVLELFSASDLRRVLREVTRVLRPGGLLCVAAMTTADVPDSRFLRAYERLYRGVPGAGRVGCRPVDVGGALAETGFAVVRRERAVRAGVWPVACVVARPR
ncbi:MAG: methylase involved in ubiquinone/menaquinone biosynthesis [uncultured archaeon A07HB70]|nr:MAG: methylase involved in ubiquinone/menaquinone biosynthesis [uncultured archaeon A07HB70]